MPPDFALPIPLPDSPCPGEIMREAILGTAVRLVAAENTREICRGGSEGPFDPLATEAGAAS